MEAIRRRVRVREDGSVEWADAAATLPPGEAEVIFLYDRKDDTREMIVNSSVVDWPVLEGGDYQGGALRREDLYDEDGR